MVLFPSTSNAILDFDCNILRCYPLAGGGMPDGMPDMGTEDDADSDDDEDLPDLEETA